MAPRTNSSWTSTARRWTPSPWRQLRHRAGHQDWTDLARISDWLYEHRDQPDEGIWETRGGRKNFTYGRFQTWVALDRAIRLATIRGRPASIARWADVRDQVYTQIHHHRLAGQRHPLFWAKMAGRYGSRRRQYPHRGDAQNPLRNHHGEKGPSPSHRRWPAMNVDLARIQFAFTSVNHFFFVPVTIGLAFLTALLQTAWYRSKREEYLRLTGSPARCW
jgi:hypothetical protein